MQRAGSVRTPPGAWPGAKVALVGLEPEELRKTAGSCGPDATAWDADVTSWEQLVGTDVAVANAGVAPTGFIRNIDPAAFERTIEINLLGVWRTVPHSGACSTPVPEPTRPAGPERPQDRR